MESRIYYYRTNRRDIAMLRFLVEAYEGIALVSTVDATKGLVCLRVCRDNLDEYRIMLNGIREHLPIEPIDPQKWGIAKDIGI